MFLCLNLKEPSTWWSSSYLRQPSINSSFSLPIDDAEDFSKFLLETYRNEKNETLMLAPGGGFYADPAKGKSQVRIAYILNLDDLRSCLQILRDGLEAYKNRK